MRDDYRHVMVVIVCWVVGLFVGHWLSVASDLLFNVSERLIAALRESVARMHVQIVNNDHYDDDDRAKAFLREFDADIAAILKGKKP